MCFAGNFILSTSCEFYFDDVIIVTSFVLGTRSVSAVFLPTGFTTPQVSNNIANYEKNEQVQRANLFKRTSNVIVLFSIYRPNSFKRGPTRLVA